MSTTTQLRNNALIIENNEDLTKPYLFDKSLLAAMPQPVKEEKPIKATFRTAPQKGTVDSTVSKQWANRPNEEKYLDLNTMRQALHERFINSRTVELNSKNILFNRDMDLELDRDSHLKLTNHAYNQLCALSNSPIEYLKRLPSDMAADCIRWGLFNKEQENVKALYDAKKKTLRAITSPTYGRIWDYEVIDQVQRVAGNGIDDTCWKVPGALDWSTNNGTTVEYNPFVDVTKETTTLYASDRDMFLFLVDDTHPIEVGKLANGEPDLMFRGFYVANSETGNSTFKVSCMLMRGVCANRNIWGAENAVSIDFRHYKTAPQKFIEHAFPKLAAFAISPTKGIIDKVQAAKSIMIAKTDEDASAFLMNRLDVGKLASETIIATCLREEGTPLRSIWNAVQGATAYARTIQHQDSRVELELKAGKLMAKVN